MTSQQLRWRTLARRWADLIDAAAAAMQAGPGTPAHRTACRRLDLAAAAVISSLDTLARKPGAQFRRYQAARRR